MANRKRLTLRRLPIYRLAPPAIDDKRLEVLAERSYGMQHYEASLVGNTAHLANDGLRFDADLETGAIWMSDPNRLWNPDLRPRLTTPADSERRARSFLLKQELLPKPRVDTKFTIARLSTSGTLVATVEGKTERRRTRQLDNYVSFGVQLEVPGPDGEGAMRLPIIGPTGKFGVTFGDKGELIGHNQAWLDLDGIETESEVIPQEVSDARFKELTSKLQLKSFDSSIAYQAFEIRGKQQLLCPVRVYRGTALIGDRVMPLRNIILPATEFGPEPSPQESQPPRVKRLGQVLWNKEQAPIDAAPKLSFMARALYRAGTSWIGLSGGLGGSQANAKGFVDGLAADGWQVCFNWGDQNAWESDWRTHDDDWVDSADFVFYTGHADGNGWVLSSPDDGKLDYTEVGAAPESPGDLYGQQNLEWAIIAACGPFEDDLICAGGGNAMSRWDGAFDGLHQLLGYGAVTNDNTEEGKRVVQYSREGSRLIDAWFRTAREIQPSTNGWPAPFGPKVWVSGMYVYHSPDPSPYNDHIWGHGSVAPDPHYPNVKVCMWSPC